jgi:hypothetical protein
MMAVQNTDSTGPNLNPDQLLAAAVLDLISPQGRGLGPTPRRIAEAARGAGRPTLTVSARLFLKLLDALEVAHPGTYAEYLRLANTAKEL